MKWSSYESVYEWEGNVLIGESFERGTSFISILTSSDLEQSLFLQQLMVPRNRSPKIYNILHAMEWLKSSIKFLLESYIIIPIYTGLFYPHSTTPTGLNLYGLPEEEYRLVPVSGRVLRAGTEVHAIRRDFKTDIKIPNKTL